MKKCNERLLIQGNQAILAVLIALLFAFPPTSALAAPRVIASIKPIHSLVASVMQGVGTPDLIVDGTGSPHTYSLKPSQAAKLEQAQVIFWVGHELESFLEKPIESLGAKSKVVSLIDIPGLVLLPPREGNGFDPHEHEVEEVHAAGHEEVDAHIWLDPENAKVLVLAIAKTLSEADAINATIYAANAASTIKELEVLNTELNAQLTPLHNKGFIVFHDAYHYFENRFGLTATAAITLNPENPPGAAAISILRQRISEGKATCVFAEPQFDSKLVNLVLEGSSVKSSVLDPLGFDLEAGPTLYPKLLRNLASALVNCLN